MRCPDCSKFVSMETECDSPENEDLSIDDNGYHLTFDVVVHRNCAECGTTLKELTYSIETEGPGEPERKAKWDAFKAAHPDKLGEIEVEFDDPDVNEGGGSRYAKNMIEVSVNYRLVYDGETIIEDDASHSEAASSFEEVA